MGVTRRRVAFVTTMVVAATAFAGCGSDESGTAASSAPSVLGAATVPPDVAAATDDTAAPVDTAASVTTPPTEAPTETGRTVAPASPASEPAAPAFPVTVEHTFGSTVIDAEPERVVSVGYTDQDAILALGVTPLTVLDWYGDQPYGVWPWAQDELGDATPELLSADALDVGYEKIAALQPDLIIGVSSGMSQSMYDTLSQIAPTVAQSGDFADFAMPWQEQTIMIGRALGREQQAQSLIDGVEERFAEIRQAHPEFEGATGTVAFVNEDGTMGAYSPDDVRGRLLAELGFVVPDELLELAGDSFFANFSTERMSLVDTDVLIWITGDLRAIDAIKADPIRQTLNAVAEGREIFLDSIELGAAMSFSSVLSLQYFLDEIEPRLVAAVDGDPSTVAE